MTDFKNRYFQIMPDNEGKILTLGCMFKELKGVLICEATEEEKEDFCCGKFMTYPIVGEEYDVWDEYEDIANGFEYGSIGKKGETIPIINLRDAFDYNARHYECDFIDILMDAEMQGVTITNRFGPDSEELLPDTITLCLSQYKSGKYFIESARNNYYIPLHNFCISKKDNQLHEIDYRKEGDNVDGQELVELIGDIVWSYMWFFNRKQIRVQIKTYSEDGHGWMGDQLFDLPKDWPEIILNLENNINDYLQKPWNKRPYDHWIKKRPDPFQR